MFGPIVVHTESGHTYVGRCAVIPDLGPDVVDLYDAVQVTPGRKLQEVVSGYTGGPIHRVLLLDVVSARHESCITEPHENYGGRPRNSQCGRSRS